MTLTGTSGQMSAMVVFGGRRSGADVWRGGGKYPGVDTAS